jgi:hypothetical protein
MQTRKTRFGGNRQTGYEGGKQPKRTPTPTGQSAIAPVDLHLEAIGPEILKGRKSTQTAQEAHAAFAV